MKDQRLGTNSYNSIGSRAEKTQGARVLAITKGLFKRVTVVKFAGIPGSTQRRRPDNSEDEEEQVARHGIVMVASIGRSPMTCT